ncbi:DUF3857 domain-containing protein [Coprobacter tertius]|uniref:DUF3857 domain-containing protein n=1 Tax=Coprobacter tertius TaxID=2944915 RepID=A0ABT1MF77_9BACT|nr:DUF3857 domain-containing protein [Coprobacter tertius]MCP9611011.1 DUF3857 domain-containing protein [Coprobacter tertius]
MNFVYKKRNSYFLLFVLLCNIFSSYSQKINLKYGKVNDDELKMTTYTPDSSADAVVLFEYSETYFDYSEKKGFQLVTDYKTKIKILNEKGLEYANISIPYFRKVTINETTEEKIIDLQGTVYNLEKGKIIKNKLKNEYIFDEQTDDYYWQKKFTLPGAKVGSVIEYKYTFYSDFYMDVPELKTQRDIPVFHSKLSFEAPDYYRYNAISTGWPPPHFTTEQGSQTFTLQEGMQNQHTSTKTLKYIMISDTVPALKPENYIWCLNDFCPKVTFELDGLAFPGRNYQPLTRTWKDLENNLTEDDNFGKLLRMKCPYPKEETEVIAQIENIREKARTTLKYVQGKINWDNKYRLSGKNIREALTTGVGNSAQINFILISTLNAVGLKAYPVLISTRDNGRIPMAFPTIDKLNTFIVAVEEADNKYFYLDGCSKYGDINVFDTNLLVEQGRLFKGRENGEWKNIDNLSRNAASFTIKAQLNDEGIITGNIAIQFTGQNAYAYKKSLGNYSIEELKEYWGDEIGCDITDYQGFAPDSILNQASSKATFSKQAIVNESMLYLNPLLIDYVKESPFTAVNRKYPIEFDYNKLIHYNIELSIPENYQINEIPKTTTIINTDKTLSCKFISSQSGNKIKIQFMFENKRSVFLPEEYKDLQTFYSAMIGKCNEQIVIQKK